MAIHLAPVMFILVAGKIVAINYEVYRRVRRDSLDRVDTIDLIDDQIAELEPALEGKAGEYAQIEIDRLEGLKKEIENMHDSERYTLGDHASDFKDATEEALDDAKDWLDRMYKAASSRVDSMQKKFEQQLDEVEEK